MMAYQPAPKTNHAAWVIGHLAQSCDFLGQLLAVKPLAPADWDGLFGMSSAPKPDAKLYPSKSSAL